jgi:predicted glycoside hydrolase/deacetylase ChbG (UPF0249 family)
LDRRPVVLCADDFGLTDGVSRGILELAAAGRLSATSAMTHRPGWHRLGPALREHEARLAVGLHLTFTLGEPLGHLPTLAPAARFPDLGTLLRGAMAKRWPRQEIAGEIERQLDAFEQVMGRPPDFVDGHQHVHVLPGIRGALIAVLGRRGARPWLRDPSDRLAAILRRDSPAKALLVRSLALGFRAAARAAGFETNEGFSGFSDFAPRQDQLPLFASALDHLGPRPLVMCHPGHPDPELAALDPVVDARAGELATLRSDSFGRLLESRGLMLAKRP